MNKIKLNLKKIGLLAITSIGLFTMSCEKETIEIEDAEAVEAHKKPEVKPVRFDYKYNYNGHLFSEQEWEAQLGTIDPTFSMIGLNDTLYVFDSETEAKLFETRDLQALMDAVNETPSLNTKDTQIASGVVSFRIDLWDEKNYAGSRYSLYYTQTVRRMQTWWGWVYLENNEYEGNIPAFMDEKTTSYKTKLIQNASVLDNGVTLRMYTKLRLGTLDEGGAEWEKLLVYNNSTHEDSDFSNNRIWGALGLVFWDNRIRSWNVEFR